MVQRGLTRGTAFLVACILLSLVFLPTSSSQAQDGGRLSLAQRQAAERNAEHGQLSDIWAVVVQPGTDGVALAASLGFEYAGQIEILPNTYLFRLTGSAAADSTQSRAFNSLNAAPQIVYFEQQYRIRRATRSASDQVDPLVPGAYPIADPLYSDQWHLENRGQNGAVPGNDILVQPAWDMGFNGSGVQIAVVDDGLEYVHPDIAPNYNPVGSYDFNQGNPDPAPNTPFDTHGTSVAGVAAARDESTCGVGAAFRASLAGVQVLSDFTTDALEAQALGFALNVNDISSNSWGPVDNGSIFGGVGSLALDAIEQGALTGRNGRGTVYVWAGGNGLQNFDYANADAFVSSRYTIGVAATDYTGRQSWYSEPGAALLVNAPSSGDGTTNLTGSELGITTTDRLGSFGYNGYPANLECTNGFGGTSSATPLVSGIVALMLDANPTLTWRDVQHILVETAARNDPTDPGWTANGARYPINHKYGFGRVNAFAAVNLAQNWFNVSPEVSFVSPVMMVNETIPAPPSSGITRGVNVGVNNASFRVEHVVVRLNAVDLYRGDLEITLTSPSGTQSILLAPRPFDGGTAIVDYDLMSTRHWGENPNGTWTIRVRDVFDDGFNGTFVDWQLSLYGNTGSNTQQVIFIDQPGLTEGSSTINAPTGVRVGLYDRHGVALDFDNVPVTISMSSGSGALLGTLTRMTVDGVATFNDLSVDTPGYVILRAVSTGYDPDYSDPFRVYDALDSLVFTVQPINALVDGSIAPAGGIKVTVVDGDGVSVPINGLPITLSIGNNPGGATLSGTLTANTVSGVATFTGLSLNQPGLGYTLNATSGALSATSTAFDIYPGDLELTFAGPVGEVHFNALLNAPTGVIVELRDSGGSLFPANGIPITLTSTGPGTLRGTTTQLSVGGIATFANIYIDAPGTHTLTASAGALTPVSSNPFEITTLSGQFCASTYAAGWTGSVAIPDNDFDGIDSTITIPDLGFDPITDINITLDIRHTYVGDLVVLLEHDGDLMSLVEGPDGFFCSGNDISLYLDDAAALSVQDDCTSGSNPTQAYTLGERYQPAEPLSIFNGGALDGDWTLTAIDTSPADVGVIFEWCINAELPPVELAFVDQPTNALPGDTLAPVTVEVLDVSGTLVPVDGLAVTIALANNPSGAVLGGTLTVNTVDGVATFSDLTVDLTGSGYTLEATASGLMSATSSPFNIGTLNMIRNGEFADGLMHWNVFDAITWQITAEVFEFFRNPVGDSAVVFQDTGIPTNIDETLYVQLDLGNSSAVRKRVSILTHNPDFSDLQICSFWLPPNAPMATYRMYLGTKRNWSSTVLSIYGNPNDGIGWILVDNVSMYNMPGPGLTETLCVDPRVPAPPGGADSVNLVSNGTFTGTLSPWGTFGAIVTRVEANVAEMYRSFGTPAGSLLQNMSASAPAGMPMEIMLDLGNSSTIRQRVTVLMHATNFSDLQVCVFWLEPGTPLQTHVIRTYSTAPWSGVSISVYPSPPTTLGWIRMDNVSVMTKPSMSVVGVECYMPGSTVIPSMPLAAAEVQIEAPPVFIPMPDALPEIPIIVPYAPESEPESSAEGSITE